MVSDNYIRKYLDILYGNCERGEAFICAYSIVDEQSFQEIQNIHDHILRVKEDSEGIPIVLVGTKSDLSVDIYWYLFDLKARAISVERGAEMAGKMNAKFMETSSKTGSNVTEAFLELLKTARGMGVIETVIITQKEPKKKKKPCSIL
jgi:GTPase KRas protein